VDDKRLIFLGVGLFALVGSCIGCGGLFALFLAFNDRPGGEDPMALDHHPVDPFDPIAPRSNGASPADREEALRQMRARYRPGPHVEVEGMLPSGRLAVARIEHGTRHGRTVDTPWIIGGAELRPGAAPDASSVEPGRPSITLADAGGELSILAGVPARLPVRALSGAGADSDVRGLYIAFHDYPGHFFLPATVDTELGQIAVAGVEGSEVIFGLDAALGPRGEPVTGAPRDVTMYVAAVDVEGRVSPYVQRPLRIMPVGTGDVEVTVTMTRSTDLDLYVIDPSGNTIYYGNTEAASGGQLDLDANAACSSNMGVDNEHIYWPSGAAPAGTYTVRVAHFESCIGGEPFEYRVTVENCGETVVLAGRFAGPANTETCDSMSHDPCDGAPAPATIPSGVIGNPGMVL
jgi:hypothetical protein